MPTRGRNDPCPCGSGRKYRHCHGSASATAAPPVVDRRALEATTANIARLLHDQDFVSLSDAQHFLDANIDRMDADDLPVPQSPVEAAQDLMYDAWDVADRRDRLRLAREALGVSADCAEAYVLLAEEAAKTPAEAVALYRESVVAGERYLGDRLVDDADTYGFGDEEEAACCAAEHMAAWAATDGALGWLAASLRAERHSQVRARAVKPRRPRVVAPR